MNYESTLQEISISYYPSKLENKKITSSLDASILAKELWDLSTIELLEEVKVIFVNKSNTPIGYYNLSKGGLSSSIVDNRIILSIALKSLATGLILVHNHPSGNLQPSNSDKSLTLKLKDACKILDITLLDHIIITKSSYFSFLDEGMI